MRRRQLKGLWARLKELHSDVRQSDARRPADQARAGQSQVAGADGDWSTSKIDPRRAAFTYRLDRKKLKQARRREGRYLLRSNLTEDDPAALWSYYIQLVQVEEAFQTLKGDLAIRPIHHQEPGRIEAHIFIAFLAYCLHVTLGAA